MLECRSCGAGAPVDEHFCPQCSRILALGRHGDYFSFLGLPRRLVIDAGDLERRFRELSRKFHPDYFYNASPTERLASLEERYVDLHEQHEKALCVIASSWVERYRRKRELFLELFARKGLRVAGSAATMYLAFCPAIFGTL